MALIEKTERLIECLRNELQQYGEMLALLDQQQANVVRRVADDLLITAAAIDTQSAAVQKARQERESCQSGLAQDLLRPGEATLAALTQLLPAKYRPLVQALVHENNQLLFRVRQRAHQNHILITRSMQLMQRLIATLVPVQPTPVYDGQGHLSAPAPRGSSLYEAVG